jgi:uncharacterized ferritin-like protein (DUF455 family)
MGTGDRMKRFDAVIARVTELAFLHRALAHVSAGWAVKVPDLSIKAALARHAYEDLDIAHKLTGHLYALTRQPADKAVLPRGMSEAARMIDLAPNADAMLVALYGIGRRHLFHAYEELSKLLDPVLDAQLLYLAHPAVEVLRSQLKYGQTVLQARLETCTDEYAEQVEAAFSRRRSGEHMELGQALWSPLDRAERAQRPASMKRAKPGSMRALPLDSARDPEGVAQFVHNLINGEYTTLELCARSSYEHPDLPASFHLAMLRQAGDEARHAQGLENVLSKLGHKYGDFPVYTLTYDAYYAFAGCDPGSKRELLFRLLVRGSIDEGLALDDFAFQIEHRAHLQQEELAELFKYLLADESFHVQSALKWSRHLCGEDETKVLAEREAANTAVNTLLDERRREFVAAHPEEAMAELVHKRRVAALEAKDPLPFTRKTNVAARKSAGYSEADLRQLNAWGYVS